MNLLIVDDNPPFRSFIRSFVTQLSREISECSDGDQAVRLCFQTKPDIVLMDIHMGRLNGLRATQAIKAQSPNTRIIIVTALDSDDLRRAAHEAGATAYILKDDLSGLMNLIGAINPPVSPP